jgi:hypothetical protein
VILCVRGCFDIKSALQLAVYNCVCVCACACVSVRVSMCAHVCVCVCVSVYKLCRYSNEITFIAGPVT